jgi:protein-L-isoaspartate O-methyltransferase
MAAAALATHVAGAPHTPFMRLHQTSALSTNCRAVPNRGVTNAWCDDVCGGGSTGSAECRTFCSCGDQGGGTAPKAAQIPRVGSDAIPRQCRRFVVASGTHQHAWPACTRVMERGFGFDFGLAQTMVQLMQSVPKQSKRPKRALELGAGVGLYADWLSRRGGHEVVAVEPDAMHTATYDGVWPKQLAVNLFEGPGEACAAALEPFEFVYSLGALQDVPRRLHGKVLDSLGNLTGGILLFAAARAEPAPAEYVEGAVRPDPTARSKEEWRGELERRGFEYLPVTTNTFQTPRVNRDRGLMVFAAPGAPLGRAAEDDIFELPAMEPSWPEMHPASQGARPLVIDGKAYQWWAPLTVGEVQTWPELTAQLGGRCFTGTSTWRSYGRIMPMVDREAKVVMAWTPRAACSLAVSIFVDHLGKRKQAERYAEGFIHSYRLDVLGPAYAATEVDLDDASLFKFKVVRNPYARAVSSYSHHLMTGAQPVQLGEVSFVEWLRTIRNIGLGPPIDYHALLQTSEAEQVGTRSYDVICKLDHNFRACLRRVNRRAGTNFSVPTVGSEGGHFALHEQMHGDVAGRPWNSFKLRDKHSNSTRPTIRNSRVLPRPSDFYEGGPAGKEAAKIVAELYAIDFEQYGYDRHVFDAQALDEFLGQEKAGMAAAAAAAKKAEEEAAAKALKEGKEEVPVCKSWCNQYTCRQEDVCGGCSVCGTQRLNVGRHGGAFTWEGQALDGDSRY